MRILTITKSDLLLVTFTKILVWYNKRKSHVSKIKRIISKNLRYYWIYYWILNF